MKKKNVRKLRRCTLQSNLVSCLCCYMVRLDALQWASQAVITLIAPNGEGVEAGKTKLNRKVDVGKVIACSYMLKNDHFTPPRWYE